MGKHSVGRQFRFKGMMPSLGSCCVPPSSTGLCLSPLSCGLHIGNSRVHLSSGYGENQPKQDSEEQGGS